MGEQRWGVWTQWKDQQSNCGWWASNYGEFAFDSREQAESLASATNERSDFKVRVVPYTDGSPPKAEPELWGLAWYGRSGGTDWCGDSAAHIAGVPCGRNDLCEWTGTREEAEQYAAFVSRTDCGGRFVAQPYIKGKKPLPTGEACKAPGLNTTIPVVVVFSAEDRAPGFCGQVQLSRPCTLSWCAKPTKARFCSTLCEDIEGRRAKVEERLSLFVAVAGHRPGAAEELHWAREKTREDREALEREWRSLRHEQATEPGGSES